MDSDLAKHHSDTLTQNDRDDRARRITDFFDIRRAVVAIDLHDNPKATADLSMLVGKYEIVDPDTGALFGIGSAFSRNEQRRLLHLLEERYVHYAPTVDAHREAITKLLDELRSYLASKNPSFSVALIGALATGNSLRSRSDMDLLIGLPSSMTDVSQLSELLYDLGFAYAPQEGDIDDIDQLLDQQRGYTRLCGIMGQAHHEVFADIFLLAEKDLRRQGKAWSGDTRRIVPSVPKTENYIAFEHPHDKRGLLKPPDRVPNYYKTNDGYHIGFIPPLLMAADIIHDPMQILADAQAQVWESVTKSHLYHNGGYERSRTGGWQVRGDVLNRTPGPLSYLWYQDMSHYSPQAATRIVGMRDEAKRTFIEKPWVRDTVDTQTDDHEFIRANTLGGEMLQAVHENRIDMVISDIDRTLLGHTIDGKAMFRLIYNAQKAELPIALITGRGVSAQRDFDHSLQLIATQSNVPVYFATNNGATVRFFAPGTGNETIVTDGTLSEDEISNIIKVYKRFGFTFSDEEYAIMGKSIDEWSGSIPDKLTNLARENRGMWIEPGKITIMIPSDRRIKKVIEQFSSALGKDFYCAANASGTVIDISRAGRSGKLQAATTLMNLSNTDYNHVAVFGDSVHGNDREILRKSRYSFTDEVAPGQTTPPYRLPGTGNFVYRTHKAISAFTRNR